MIGASRDLVLVIAGGLLLAAAFLACAENRTPSGEEVTPPLFDCLPNLDGQLDASELPLTLGLEADYFVSPDGTAVDLSGSVDSEGRRVWDFTSATTSDERIAIAAEPIAGKWYESPMSGATFVIPQDSGGLDGAYIRDERGLSIVGLASSEENPPGGRTLLVYEQPVLVLRFPVIPEQAFSAAADIAGGTLNGLPYNGTDTYDVTVDGIGRAELPDVTFTQSYRVRTDVEVAPAVGGVTTTRRQVSFFFECFGEVVRATSRANEPNADFANAAEVRRFAL